MLLMESGRVRRTCAISDHLNSVRLRIIRPVGRWTAPVKLAVGASAISAVLWCSPLEGGPVAVRFTEGVTHAFPVLRSQHGDKLAGGDLVQVMRGDRVESRLVFRFGDGSLYEEIVVFSQRDVFTLVSYRLVQRGPSFPEMIEAVFDRETGKYEVRYRADDDSPEEVIAGRLALPADAYNGMLAVLMKNLPPNANETVHIVAFTPRPRLVKTSLVVAGEELVLVGDTPLRAVRYKVVPQLGSFAAALVTDLPAIQCWILRDDVPAFLKFEGPLYFMGPIWRIDLN